MELDVEAVRMGAEVGGMASGAGTRDGKTVAKRWCTVKSCKSMIQAAANKVKCWRSFAEAEVRNCKYDQVSDLGKWLA